MVLRFKVVHPSLAGGQPCLCHRLLDRHVPLHRPLWRIRPLPRPPRHRHHRGDRRRKQNMHECDLVTHVSEKYIVPKHFREQKKQNNYFHLECGNFFKF